MACQPVAESPLLESSGSVPHSPSASRGRDLLEAHFELIQKKLQRLGRHSGLPEHETDELRSWALLKLVEDDCRLLSRWEGRSSFSTYLTVVLSNLMRDYRIHVWGKWRPSAAAKRQGSDAVLLERLLFRDGLTLSEAIRRMREEHGVSRPDNELERIAGSLPQRTRRRSVAGEDELLELAVDGRVEARVENRERAAVTARLHDVMPALLRALPPEEILLLKLHYQEGLSMAAISPVLGKPPRELYSLRDKCLKKLRSALEKAGLDAERVLSLCPA